MTFPGVGAKPPLFSTCKKEQAPGDGLPSSDAAWEASVNGTTGADQEDIAALTDALGEVDEINRQIETMLVDAGSSFEQLGKLLDTWDAPQAGPVSGFQDQSVRTLEELGDQWLRRYEDALDIHHRFLGEFNAIVVDVHRDIEADAESPQMNSLRARVDLTTLIDFHHGEAGALASFDTEDAAREFVESLDLASLVIDTLGEKARVRYDLRPLEVLRDSLPSHTYERMAWSADEYRAWTADQVQVLQHIGQALAEEYSCNLQVHDDLTNSLSALVESIRKADAISACLGDGSSGNL